MRYEVIVAANAQRDMEDIVDYILEHDTEQKALHVLTEFTKCITSLQSYPNRGSIVRELDLEQGLKYRQLHFAAYRIIYRVESNRVRIILIADGRRNMRTLLKQRLG
ncbi:type II toxin-antitoxin system RelE/ParE family toxin [bacterium]|nr:type II toxin-antitoxin system RelE/ParE family toxin [bacterium]